MWKDLSNFQKAIFILLICLIVPFAPEFIFLVDLGGIELVFSFLVLYYQPVIIKLKTIYSGLKCELKICTSAFKKSAIIKPKVYFTQALFYSCAVVISGSVLYASVFFLPAIILNGTLV